MSPSELEQEKTRAWKFLALSLAGLLTLLVVVSVIGFFSPKKNGAGNTQSATTLTETVTVSTVIDGGGKLVLEFENMTDELRGDNEKMTQLMLRRTEDGWVYCGFLPEPYAGTMVFQRRIR